MAGIITIYTRTSCPYCELVKKFLDMKGASYQTVNIEESADGMQAIMAMTGKAIAPTTVIEKDDGSKDVVVGFNLSRIAPAIA